MSGRTKMVLLVLTFFSLIYKKVNNCENIIYSRIGKLCKLKQIVKYKAL